MTNPLQALNCKLLFGEQINPVLESVEQAENSCLPIYNKLTARTNKLADQTLTVHFAWRVRVGGMRGFRELLLPVFHPVYGVPYIPASSLKGVARAWAKNDNNVDLAQINFLLGQLDEGVGAVQILDAFPTEPCLSIDIANPQWHWQQDNQVQYNPQPHFFLSMKEPEIVIGLKLTGRGIAKSADVNIVKNWLENALKTGIGSRVSAGYGRTSNKAALPYSSEHHFHFYSQGVYGANPPNKENNWQGDTEFRSIALRGVLRYWFRAIALGLYDVETTKRLENQLFGQLSQEGTIRLSTVITEKEQGNRKHPYYWNGFILLEAKKEKHLNLIEYVLKLASHIGGFGRGSRRPLHLNNKRLRGCYWELSDFILPCAESDWQIFIEDVLDSFRAIQPETNPSNLRLENQNNRYQDVLNYDTNIFLIPSEYLEYPSDVDDWYTEGYENHVLGEGLRLLYSSDLFKGRNPQGRGNVNVGGTLGIPSFVWIKSNYPDDEDETPYQTVTIFGVNQRDREYFAKEMSRQSHQSIQVW